ncbi:MAG: isopentenyl-diphosphate delta-isomerase [halophilic archaeon J07HX64]|jgi:isopentenyl-diphosphate delta-isomerase (EC 5.3.3.2)|nr:MAG: isopentenyl-diphosphate delta-isomerase [halophilic archaeon J07HX64]
MAKAGDSPDHENATQEVVAVDADDHRQEIVNRLAAHTGEGIRHRAFTALLFDEDGRILLAQRSPDKRLWDDHWDGTVASHPREDESQIEAARQRLDEELGVTPDQYDTLTLTDRFEYRRRYYDEGIEHEVCAVLQATLEDTHLDPDPDEVAGVLWAPYERLTHNRRWYRQLRLCPWFEIAIRRDMR